MTIERKRKEFQLMLVDIQYINEIAEKHRIRPGDALSKIIREHKDADLSKLENTMGKILLSMNNLKKLSEVQLEIINSICLKKNYQENDFVARSDFTSDLVSKAYKNVEKEIVNNNIKKFNK